MTELIEAAGLGRVLHDARVAQGISREALAREMNLTLQLLEAIEAENWQKVPAGRERPLVRILARRLRVDLALYADAWDAVPGVADQEGEDPRREIVDRLIMGAMTVGSIAVLAWLLIPGRDLKSNLATRQPTQTLSTLSTWTPPKSDKPFPVLGQALPEAPVNDQGVLVELRSVDVCAARIENDDGQTIQQTLRVSEPWTLRVKGPFTLTLDNGGVVALEVAGRRIQHGASVAESWSGRFSQNGTWLLPPKEVKPELPTTPDTDPETLATEE